MPSQPCWMILPSAHSKSRSSTASTLESASKRSVAIPGWKQLAYEEGSGEPTLPRMQPAKGVQFPLVLCGSLMNFEKWDYSTVRYSCSHSSHGNFVATASDTFYTVTLVTGIWDLWHHGLLSKVGEPGSKHFLDFDRLDLLCTAREATETSQGAVETETKPVAEGRDSNWMWLRKALQASSHKDILAGWRNTVDDILLHINLAPSLVRSLLGFQHHFHYKKMQMCSVDVNWGELPIHAHHRGLAINQNNAKAKVSGEWSGMRSSSLSQDRFKYGTKIR